MKHPKGLLKGIQREYEKNQEKWKNKEFYLEKLQELQKEMLLSRC